VTNVDRLDDIQKLQNAALNLRSLTKFVKLMDKKKGHRDLIRALRAFRALRASSFKAAVSASESQQKMDCSPGRIPDLSKQPALSNSAASMCLPSSSWLKYFWQAELKAASQLTLPKVSKSNTP
jgi:hypothetical protein